LIILALLFASCQEGTDKLSEKYAAYEHFYFQRTFPDSSVDQSVLLSSVDEARKTFALSGAKEIDTEWIQEGPFNIGGRINIFNNRIWLTRSK